MRFISFKKQEILIVAGVLLGIVAVIFLVIMPTIGRLESARQQIFDIQGLLDTRQRALQHARRTLVELDDVEKEIEMYRGAFIRPGEELAAIEQFERIAGASGVEQHFTVALVDAPKKGGNNLSFYQFSFTNQGSFQEHLNYLRALEKLPYLLVIDGVTFNRKDEGGDVSLTARFIARLYVSKE